MSPESFGPYRVVRELGRGGMGVVYEVRHPQTPNRRLALKTLLTASLDPADVLRFQREAHLLAQLDHPNVVRVHQLGQQGESLFVVLDFVAGPTFDTLLRDGPLPPQRAARLLIQLAEGVQALHDAGIVHRDLKPQNVVLRPDGSPVLLDFGLAREVDGQSLTQTGAVLGTPQFMSPEQARGDEQRKLPAVDVYGLGAVLYACLSGRPPFDGPLLSILYDVASSAPPLAGVPRPIAKACLKALSKEPHARYASPHHFAQALERASAARPTPRRPSWALPSLALAVAVGLGVALRPSAPAPSAPEPEAVAPSDARETTRSVPWYERDLEDPRRWRGYRDQAGLTPDTREALLRQPLLRFRDPGSLEVPAESLYQIDTQVRWLDDHRLLVFDQHHLHEHSVVCVDLDAGSLAPSHRWEPFAGGKGLTPLIVDVRVAPDRESFAFLTRNGLLHWVDARTGAAKGEPVEEGGDPLDVRGVHAFWRVEGRAHRLSMTSTRAVPRALALGPRGQFAVGGDYDVLWTGTLGDPDPRAIPTGTNLHVRRLTFDTEGRHVLAIAGPEGVQATDMSAHSHGALVRVGLAADEVLTQADSVYHILAPLPGGAGYVVGSATGIVQALTPDLTPSPFSADPDSWLHRAHDNAVSALHAHGRVLFSACRNDSSSEADIALHRWNLDDHRPLEPTLPPAHWIRTIDVSPDGTLLALGLNSGWIEVWHVP